MTGFNDGVLGFEKESVLKTIIYGEKSKFAPPEEGRGLFSAVVLDVDENTGKTNEIIPIYYVEE